MIARALPLSLRSTWVGSKASTNSRIKMYASVFSNIKSSSGLIVIGLISLACPGSRVMIISSLTKSVSVERKDFTVRRSLVYSLYVP